MQNIIHVDFVDKKRTENSYEEQEEQEHQEGIETFLEAIKECVETSGDDLSNMVFLSYDATGGLIEMCCLREEYPDRLCYVLELARHTVLTQHSDESSVHEDY